MHLYIHVESLACACMARDTTKGLEGEMEVTETNTLDATNILKIFSVYVCVYKCRLECNLLAMYICIYGESWACMAGDTTKALEGEMEVTKRNTLEATNILKTLETMSVYINAQKYAFVSHR